MAGRRRVVSRECGLWRRRPDVNMAGRRRVFV